MDGRVKLQVLRNDGRWRTVWVKPDMLMANITLLKSYGIKFRVVEEVQSDQDRAAT